MRKKALFGIIFLIIVSGIFFIFKHEKTGETSQSARASTTTQPKSSTTNITKTFNRKLFSLSDPASIWIVVNKHRPLNPKSYAPNDLVVPDIAKRSNITSTERQVRQVTAGPLKNMFEAATTDGINLTLESGYRSYDFQVTLYNGYVSSQGQATADTQSARPGFSEHQTGLAADIGGTSQPACNVEQCYKDTVEGKWLAANAFKYGFIIRYTIDKTAVTGYTYEPWHVRYVGTDLSQELHTKGIETLEEFFDLGSAPDYQ